MNPNTQCTITLRQRWQKYHRAMRLAAHNRREFELTGDVDLFANAVLLEHAALDWATPFRHRLA